MADPSSEQRFTILTTDVAVTLMLLLLAATLFRGYWDTIIRWYYAVLAWFYTLSWSRVNTVFALIFLVINFFLLLFIINTLRKYRELTQAILIPISTTPVHKIAPEEETAKNWADVHKLIDSPNSSDWNMAIIRADALLDDVLKHMGYDGESIAERLKIVDPHKVPSLDNVWSAHRLRNNIAHDPLVQHTKESISYALRAYEQILKELGML